MKKIGVFIITLIMITSCSVKKITVRPENSLRGDAVFCLIVPDNNYGKSEDIHIYSWIQGRELNINRVLIDFDLSKIPTSAKIEKAYLNLYFNPTSAYNEVGGNKGNQGSDSILIQRVISDWNEKDVTWNRQPKTTAKNQVTIGKKKDPMASYKKIEITNIIQDIIKDENGQFGIMIRHKDEVPYNVVFFASSNHPNIKLHPTLTIYYKNKQ
jgi:hypothetical protein